MTTKPKMADCTCRHCGAAFQYKASAVARGRGRFCTRRCALAYGRPLRVRPALAERLDQFTLRSEDGCWGWAGFKHQGYGRLSVGRNAVGAHRIRYELHVGPVPAGLTVLHRCDNRECTNPDHLFLGTNADNNADRDAKGRAARGERIGNAKLDNKKVRLIRQKAPATRRERKILAAAVGVEEQAVKAVLVGKTWGHVQ